ncbi:MAG: hypothetical protein ACKVQS_04900 [Fimbriimonadaceae bacterium]
MKRTLIAITATLALGFVVGCANNDVPAEKPKGEMPETKQATPDMKSPEERAAAAQGAPKGDGG